MAWLLVSKKWSSGIERQGALHDFARIKLLMCK
jgi:hypothetical protein